jgi:quinol monooxygenase YgiN
MQKVTVLFPCQPGKGKDMLEILSAALVETRAYDGCLSVEAFVDADKPDTVVLIEEWETRGHNERYMAWRVENGLVDMLQPILAGPLEIHFLDERPI